MSSTPFHERFPDPLILRALSPGELRLSGSSRDQLYEIQADFRYHSPSLGGFTVTCPKGLITDFASIPRPLWWWMDPEDPRILYPSLIHDGLYTKGADAAYEDTPVLITQRRADLILIEAMEYVGATAFDRALVYAGVRLGGRPHWQTA